MKYQTHNEYSKIKYILKHKFMELELPKEAKEIISDLVSTITGDDNRKHACLLRAFYLRSFEWAATSACEQWGESLNDELEHPHYDKETESLSGNVDIARVFKEWMEREKQEGVDLEYIGCVFLDGLKVAEKFRDFENGVWTTTSLEGPKEDE